MRYSHRIDGNQPEIVKAARAIGATVRITSQLRDGGGDATVGWTVRLPFGPVNARKLLRTSLFASGLHQRVPVFLGSKAEVEAAVEYHLAHDRATTAQPAEVAG